MRKFKHVLAYAGLAAAASGTMLLGSAAPAVADVPATATVRIDGRFDLVDDDWDYDPTAYEYFSKSVTIAQGTQQTVIIKSRVCAGNEVRGELRLSVSYYASGNLYVDGIGSDDGIRLYEGTSCSTTDLDGISTIYGPGKLAVGQAGHEHAWVGNVDEGGDDRATVDFTATRTS